MAAVTQIRYRHSVGRACYDRKLAEGKTPKRRSAPEAARQRRHLRRLQADARHAVKAASAGAREGNRE
jgi:hypothetical protein